MLGRLRRVTRTDVSLALAATGLAYLVWALVAGFSRVMVREMIRASAGQDVALPTWTLRVKLFFVDFGFVIDLTGLAMLAAALLLVFLASRQRLSATWPMLIAWLQTAIAAGGAVLVAMTMRAPSKPTGVPVEPTTLEEVSSISLGVVLAVAVLLWVIFLVVLLVERFRFDRHGPTLRDGLRSNIFR